uniref:Uncharacterized protein n=1 Tax=viral metagenome TaxID=1070528 RepID=A0A6M3KJF2_9ZZZZ
MTPKQKQAECSKAKNFSENTPEEVFADILGGYTIIRNPCKHEMPEIAESTKIDLINRLSSKFKSGDGEGGKMIGSHVTGLEISKKLKNSGWKKETEFYWIFDDFPFDKKQNKYKIIRYESSTENYFYNEEGKRKSNCFFAPLATEILEELPIGTCIRKGWGFKNDYVVFDNESNEICDDENPANALAKSWLYLKQEGLFK